MYFPTFLACYPIKRRNVCFITPHHRFLSLCRYELWTVIMLSQIIWFENNQPPEKVAQKKPPKNYVKDFFLCLMLTAKAQVCEEARLSCPLGRKDPWRSLQRRGKRGRGWMRRMERRSGEVCQILGLHQQRIKQFPCRLYRCEDVLKFK